MEVSKKEVKPYVPVPPYPLRVPNEKMDRSLANFIDTLKKLHVNMPFLEVLSQMPKYAKFSKFLKSENWMIGINESAAFSGVPEKKINHFSSVYSLFV